MFTFKCKCKTKIRKITPFLSTNSNNCNLEINLKDEIFCTFCQTSNEHRYYCIYKFHPNVDSDAVCCICIADRASVCLLPCSHSFCAECVFKMKECAICRTPKHFYCFKVR